MSNSALANTRGDGTDLDGQFDHDLLSTVNRHVGLWAASGSSGAAADLAARFLMGRLAADRVVVGLIEDRALAVSLWATAGRAVSGPTRSVIGLDDGRAVAAAAKGGGVVVVAGDEAARSGFGEGTLSLVAFPLLVGDVVIGAVGLESRQMGGFTLGASSALALGRALGLALDYVRVVERGERSLRETVTVLAALVEARDSYTESHCVILAEMGLAVGIRMGLSADRLDVVTYGGLLHDLGKVSVPDAVLLKPGPLTAAEFATMKTHAEVGESVLGRIGAFREVAPVVGQHHERFDGSGYPRGLGGDDIVLEARILAVADAFDAMTSARPYRPALAWPKAMQEIRTGAGSQFDPEVAEVFLRYLEAEEEQWTKNRPF